MKIALFTDGIYPYVIGGMQKHSYYLAKFLAQKGISVLLFHVETPDSKISSPFSSEESALIKEIRVPFPKLDHLPGHYLRESSAYSRRLAEYFDQEKEVDFIYAQGLSAWQLLKYKKQGRQYPPICVNLHGLEVYQQASGWKSRLEQIMLTPSMKFNLQEADFVQSLGGKLTNILREKAGIPSERIWEIPIGLDESWLQPPSKQSPSSSPRHFVFIGRYERRKGLPELHEVLTKLAQQESFHFSFIGPIPEDKRLNIQNLTYHGLIKEQEKIRQILHDADVLVSPSYAEGMPTVILEAMASECAIIGTDVGAVSMQIDESNGWLIPPGDKSKLGNAIIEAIQIEEGVLRQMKNHSREKIESHFLWEKVIEQTLEHIQGATQSQEDFDHIH